MVVMLGTKSIVLVLSKKVFESHLFFLCACVCFFNEVTESLDFIFTQMEGYGPVHWTHIRNQSIKHSLIIKHISNKCNPCALKVFEKKKQDI